MQMRYSVMMAAAAAMLVGSGPAFAQFSDAGIVDAGGADASDTGAKRSNAVIGIGVGFSPEYEGSDSYQAGVVPFGRFSFGEHEQYLEFGPNPGSRTYQARLNVMPWQGIEVGPMLTYRGERDHVESQAVRRLGHIDSAGEAGAFGKYWLPLELPGHNVALEFSGAADFTDTYNGWWIQPAVTYKNSMVENVVFSGRFYADYASDNYMETYFGVDANQAARSGLRESSAEAGFKDVGLTLGVKWLFTENWFTGATATYERLVNDAGSSPVTRQVGSKNQAFGGGYIGYQF